MFPSGSGTAEFLGLFALALLLLARRLLCFAGLLLVHDELCVALLSVPLEACEVGVVELVVGLDLVSV